MLEEGVRMPWDLRDRSCSILKTVPGTLTQRWVRERWQAVIVDVSAAWSAVGGDWVLAFHKICSEAPPHLCCHWVASRRMGFLTRVPWQWNGPGPHCSFVLKATCSLFSCHQQAVDTWLTIYCLSTYLFSPTRPANSRGYLSNRPLFSFSCSQHVWETVQENATTGWYQRVERGSGLTWKTCGLKEVTACSPELLEAFWRYLNVSNDKLRDRNKNTRRASPVSRPGLPDWANKNKWYPINPEFQRSNNIFFSFV